MQVKNASVHTHESNSGAPPTNDLFFGVAKKATSSMLCKERSDPSLGKGQEFCILPRTQAHPNPII